MVLVPLLGVTWLFGFLAPSQIAFKYIFVILNSTQVKCYMQVQKLDHFANETMIVFHYFYRVSSFSFFIA